MEWHIDPQWYGRLEICFGWTLSGNIWEEVDTTKPSPCPKTGTWCADIVNTSGYPVVTLESVSGLGKEQAYAWVEQRLTELGAFDYIPRMVYHAGYDMYMIESLPGPAWDRLLKAHRADRKANPEPMPIGHLMFKNPEAYGCTPVQQSIFDLGLDL